MANTGNTGNRGGDRASHEQHVKAGEQSHKNQDQDQSKQAGSSGQRGGTHERACADFCVNGIVLKLRNAAFELDGKAVERRLPIMDGKRPFFTDVA